MYGRISLTQLLGFSCKPAELDDRSTKFACNILFTDQSFQGYSIDARKTCFFGIASQHAGEILPTGQSQEQYACKCSDTIADCAIVAA